MAEFLKMHLAVTQQLGALCCPKRWRRHHRASGPTGQENHADCSGLPQGPPLSIFAFFIPLFQSLLSIEKDFSCHLTL